MGNRLQGCLPSLSYFPLPLVSSGITSNMNSSIQTQVREYTCAPGVLWRLNERMCNVPKPALASCRPRICSQTDHSKVWLCWLQVCMDIRPEQPLLRALLWLSGVQGGRCAQESLEMHPCLTTHLGKPGCWSCCIRTTASQSPDSPASPQHPRALPFSSQEKRNKLGQPEYRRDLLFMYLCHLFHSLN